MPIDRFKRLQITTIMSEAAYPSTYNNISLSSGENVSYISAGSPILPVLLLLHGFPSSSNQYRNLIPLLSTTYNIIAPDLPGFGLTTVASSYIYTFENLATTISAFLTALSITSYAVYIFDYGAPVGLRLATANPQSVKAIISQSGNAYVEGLSHLFWDPFKPLWASNSNANRDAVRAFALQLAPTISQYTRGVPAKDLPLVDPAAYTYDYLQNLQPAEQQEIQLDLLYDYRNNVAAYPTFQEYFRKYQVPLLAVWGKGDPVFAPAGAHAFKRDLPAAKVVLLDGGHFLLETKVNEVADEVLGFLKEVGF